MARRSKFTGMQFGRPLVLPTSTRVLHCYTSHGKGYGFAPPPSMDDTAVRILAVNSARDVRWEDATYRRSHKWICPALASDETWLRLGWIMADGSLPYGELDAVDPELAQFDFLPWTNSFERCVNWKTGATGGLGGLDIEPPPARDLD